VYALSVVASFATSKSNKKKKRGHVGTHGVHNLDNTNLPPLFLALRSNTRPSPFFLCVSISIRRNKRDEKGGGDRSLTRATARVSCHGLAKSVNNNTALKLSQQPHTGWMVDGWMDGPGYFFFLLTPPIPFLLSSPPPPERQRFPAHAKTFRRIDRAHRNCNQTESRAEQRRG
jgi:hypothetical protein